MNVPHCLLVMFVLNAIHVEGFTSPFIISNRHIRCFKRIMMSQQNDSNGSDERTLEEIQLQMIEEKLKQVANRRMEMAKQLEAAELERSRLAAEVQKAKQDLLVESQMGKENQDLNEFTDRSQAVDSKIDTKEEEATAPVAPLNTTDQTKANDTSAKSKNVQEEEENKAIQDPVEMEQTKVENQERDEASKSMDTSSEDAVTFSSPSLQEGEQKKEKNEKDDDMSKLQSMEDASEATKNKKKTLMEYFSEQEQIQAKESNDSDKVNNKEASETKKNKNETLLDYLNQHKIDRHDEYESNPKALNMADYLKENQWKDAETALKDFERKLQSGEMNSQVNEKLKIAKDQLKEVQKQLEEYKDSAPYATTSNDVENVKRKMSQAFKVQGMNLNDYLSSEIYSKIKVPGASELIAKLKSLTSDQMVSIGTPMASLVLFAALRSALEDRPVKKAERNQEWREQISRINLEKEEKGQSSPQKQQESKATKSSYSKWEEPITPRKEGDMENQDIINYQSPSKSTLYDSEPFVSYNAPDDNDLQLESTEMEDESSLPDGWYEYIDPASGNPYYWNENTGVTTWDNPSLNQ